MDDEDIDFDLICGYCGIVLESNTSRREHELIHTEQDLFPSEPDLDNELINIVDFYSHSGQIYDLETQPDLEATQIDFDDENEEITLVQDNWEEGSFEDVLNLLCTYCGLSFTSRDVKEEHEKNCEKKEGIISQEAKNTDISIKMDETIKMGKSECSMGDQCFRKKVSHFEQFTHQHLDTLLSRMDESMTIPANYEPKISRKTLLEQLEIVKSLKENIVMLDESVSKTVEDVMEEINKIKNAEGVCIYGEDCYRKNPHHFMHNRHPHLDELIKKYSGDVPDSECKKMSLQTFREQISFVKKFFFPTIYVKTSNPSDPLTASTSASTSTTLNQDYKMTLNAKLADEYKAMTFHKDNSLLKLQQAEPYNFFLTTVTSSRATHTDMNSMCFSDLLDPHLGELESSLQINFMVQFGWLLAQYQIMGQRGKPMTLIYGEIDMEVEGKYKHITSAKIKPPSPFGTHHTKMMIFAYKDESVRIVVSTANLVESDWDNKTQGLWISPKCPLLPEGSDTMAGESPTNFKWDLLRYLNNYQIPEIVPWTSKILKCDMSFINVFFIASIPGSHLVDKDLWGQNKLRKVLNQMISVPENNKYPVIVQSSSIGTLGPNPDSWLMGDMLTTFTSGKKDGLCSQPPLHFIYPSYKNIVHSYDGILGGGCLPYSQRVQDKQLWLTGFMSQWISEKRHRTRAPPHIKTYCRVSPDYTKLSYFLLTSANLSKAAWGNILKSGSLNILSYEAGVLFLPQIIVGEEHFPLEENNFGVPVFPLPYDLPPTPFKYDDTPWVIDHLL